MQYDENARKAAQCADVAARGTGPGLSAAVSLPQAVEHERAAKSLAAEVVTLLGQALRCRLDNGERALHVHRPAADADFVKALAASLDEALAEAQGLLLA